MLSLTACSRLGYLSKEKTLPLPVLKTYEEVKITAEFCRGKGQIVSNGDLRGRLNFSFSTSRDSTFIQFKDLIGRKTLFLIIADTKIEAWDMRHNRRYDEASILLTLPFLEMTRPQDLRVILWGEVPGILVTEAVEDKPSLSGQVQIHSEPTEYGPLVFRVTFHMEEDRQQAELTITNREFGLQYPHLKKNIPPTVPLVRLDS